MNAVKSKDSETVSPALQDAVTPVTTAEPLRWMHGVRRALPLVFLALVSVLAVHELRGLDLHAVREALQTLSLPQLLSVQFLALAGVFAMTVYDWRAARALDIRLPPSTLVRNAWIANSFNNMIGLSGLAGSGIRMLLLTGEHIEVGRAAAYSGLIMASVPVGLSVLCWPLLLSGGPGVDKLPIPAWTVWLALGGFAAYLPAYFFALTKGMFSRVLSGLPPQSGVSLLGLISFSTLDWLLAAAAAWLATDLSGAAIPWSQFLSGFVMASALGIMSLIPGGLGVFDAALVVLLAPLASGAEAMVSGVLLYRLCYYLVPWFIGVYVGADKLVLSEHWQRLALARQWREHRMLALVRLPLNLLASLGVRVLAYLTFGGGVVLLVSAAFPTLADRLEVLILHVPLAAIEVSHLLSVAIGVLLIALSRGIAEQVRGAYHVTVALLIGGAVFSLLKGIDYEEAITLTAVALLLRMQRRRFYRESYPLFSFRSLAWLAALLVSIVGFAWLGDWVHGDIPLGWTYLSRFEPALEAPRFARALLVAASVAVGFIGWSFFRRPRAAPALPDAQELAEVEAVLDHYGGSRFSHLVFLGDKYLQWSPDRKAFVQYAPARERLVALGDPCGDPAAFDAAIIAFREYADRHDLTPCFYEVGEALIPRYHDAGFALFKLGETALVKLADFTTAGKRGEALRHGVNRARRGGVSIELFEQPLPPDLWPQLRAVSDAWLAEHHTAEKGFSLGNYNEAYLRRAPIAAARVADRVVAFANLMPDYGSRTELSIDLMRHHPDAPPGTMDYLFVELLEYARRQGYRHFNLGISPLGGVGKTRYARPSEKLARLAFEFGNRFYNYKGLRSFKEKFHPEWRSTYLAYPILTPLLMLLVDTAALIAGGYRRIFLKTGKR
jgi:phosphatidylglycerol lysyltransferase